MRCFTPALLAFAIAAASALIAPERAAAYPLTPEQEARLKQYLPNVYNKLKNREPIHIVALGDSITEYYGYGPDAKDALRSWAGVFAQELAKEFFYTGGVRIIKPEKGQPEKADPALGPEITMRNLARGGSTIHQAFQHLTVDAFLNEPDIIMMCWGVNDRFSGLVSQPQYKEVYDAAIAYALERKAAVIVSAPTGSLMEPARKYLGMTRDFATTVREVAEKRGVFCADPWLAMTRVPSALPREGDSGFGIAHDATFVYYDHGVDDFLEVHPNAKGQAAIGKAVFQQLLNGLPQPDYSVDGTIVPEKDGTLTATLTLKNESGEKRAGFLCPLDMIRLIHVLDAQDAAFELGAGEAATFTFRYGPDEEVPHHFTDEPFFRLPLYLTDNVGGRMLDAKPRVTPLAVCWNYGLRDNLSGGIPVEFRLENATAQPIAGTYRIRWNGAEKSGDFQVQANGSLPAQVVFPIPSNGDIRAKSFVDLTVSFGGREFTARREMEATRNLGLSERIILAPRGRYQPDAPHTWLTDPPGEQVTFRAEADDKALYLIYDIGADLALTPTKENLPVVADFIIDGRQYGERRTPGFIETVVTEFPAEDGPGVVHHIQEAAFGNGYDRDLPEVGIGTKFETRPNGSHRVTITVPRSYLYRHEWALGNGNSQLGFNVALMLLRVTEERPDGEHLEDFQFALGTAMIHYRDPLGVSVLELTEKPTGRWSARLY